MQGRLAAGGRVAVALGALFALVILGGCFWCLLPTSCSSNAATVHAQPQSMLTSSHTARGPLCCCCADYADQPERVIYLSMPAKASFVRTTPLIFGSDDAPVQVMSRAQSHEFSWLAVRPGVLACSVVQSTSHPKAAASTELEPAGHLEISDQCVLIAFFIMNCSNTTSSEHPL